MGFYSEHRASLSSTSAVSLVNQLMDALAGRGDKVAIANRLASFPMHSNARQGSGNVFEPMDVLSLIMALGQPGVALDYIERNIDDRYTTLDYALVRAPLDPIRCEPRFQAAAKKLNIIDIRAAKLCRPMTLQ